MKDSELPTEQLNKRFSKKERIHCYFYWEEENTAFGSICCPWHICFHCTKGEKKKKERNSKKKISYIDCCLGFHFGFPLWLQHQQEWLLSHECAAQQVTRLLHERSMAFFLVSQLCEEEIQLPLITVCYHRGYITHCYSLYYTVPQNEKSL